MPRCTRNASIRLCVYVAVVSTPFVTACRAESSGLSPAEQFRSQALTEIHDTISATLLTALVEIPNSQATYAVWGLRRYYDQVVDDAPLWRPRGTYVHDSYRDVLYGIREGHYKLSPPEAKELQRARAILFQPPTPVERLKGVTVEHLKPAIERQLNQQLMVIRDLTEKLNRFDQGLIFTGFAELLSQESKINQAFRTLREYNGLQERSRKQQLLSRFSASVAVPVFDPVIPDWLKPVGWREIQITGNGGLGTCLVDIRRIRIIRPWLDDSIFTARWFEVERDSDAWKTYQTLKQGNESFLETLFAWRPVELILAANKRLTGQWTPQSLAELPLTLRELKSDPLIVGLVVEKAPPGPFPDLTRFAFAP
jgi:hypothetical protein